MALHTYELNDFTGVTCKECLAKKTVVVSNVNASSSALSSKDCLLLDGSCSSQDNFTGKLLADPNRLKPVSDKLEPKQATLEGELKQSQLVKSGAIFLFEKRLTPSDCDPKIGRLLMPKFHAQKLFPLPSNQRKKAVVIIDTKGTVWKFTLRWWPNKKSRKYVLDGATQCCQTMQWKAGDTLKFYRKLSDGKMIMELQKGCGSTSSVIPSAADAPDLKELCIE